MPNGVPIELFVTVHGPHDWAANDLARLDRQLTALIGYPILISHTPPAATNILPGEKMIFL
ncbi:hypothetical protein [Granulicoccus sp. GXG6511]|uniref:hypothetical protein n=1 Tax=Granulicoccus sp. GXG6511 TaxID=3381351 RepID=UPI003D7E5768